MRRSNTGLFPSSLVTACRICVFKLSSETTHTHTKESAGQLACSSHSQPRHLTVSTSRSREVDRARPRARGSLLASVMASTCSSGDDAGAGRGKKQAKEKKPPTIRKSCDFCNGRKKRCDGDGIKRCGWVMCLLCGVWLMCVTQASSPVSFHLHREGKKKDFPTPATCVQAVVA